TDREDDLRRAEGLCALPASGGQAARPEARRLVANGERTAARLRDRGERPSAHVLGGRAGRRRRVFPHELSNRRLYALPAEVRARGDATVGGGGDAARADRRRDGVGDRERPARSGMTTPIAELAVIEPFPWRTLL